MASEFLKEARLQGQEFPQHSKLLESFKDQGLRQVPKIFDDISIPSCDPDLYLPPNEGLCHTNRTIRDRAIG